MGKVVVVEIGAAVQGRAAVRAIRAADWVMSVATGGLANWGTLAGAGGAVNPGVSARTACPRVQMSQLAAACKQLTAAAGQHAALLHQSLC